MSTVEKIALGKTGIHISPIGLGIMQWGDIKLTKNTDSSSEIETKNIFSLTLNSGINFFDTAEMYGSGRSEVFLGRCLKDNQENVIVATKFMPFPWRLTKSELRVALRKSLNRLGIKQIDLYQMHWPFPPVPITSWMETMADAVADGLIKAVGVSNYSTNQTQIAFDALAKRGIPLASNQVRYSLLYRNPEKNGLLELCKKLGVTIIAYSPLEKGILSGKYRADNPPSGFRSWRYSRNYLLRIEPIFETFKQIGKNHDGKTLSQVSLNWLISKGAVPIPGARSTAQAMDNAGAIGWQLSNEEVARLDQISEAVLQ